MPLDDATLMMLEEKDMPATIYKLGEPKRVVNSHQDLEYWYRRGWTLTPQTYQYQEYPAVRYKSAHPPRRVLTKSEDDALLADGWKKFPAESAEEDEMRRDLEYHEAKAQELREKLSSSSEDDDLEDEDEEQAEKYQAAPDPVTPAEFVPTRGRPRKKA